MFVTVRSAPNPASTCSPDLFFETDSLKRRDRLKAYFSEETELKETNSLHVLQQQPKGSPWRQALDGPALYEFKVAQSLSDQLATCFDGLELACDDQGNTLLSGTIIDQAALHGVLARIRDLNLILLSVIRK